MVVIRYRGHFATPPISNHRRLSKGELFTVFFRFFPPSPLSSWSRSRVSWNVLKEKKKKKRRKSEKKKERDEQTREILWRERALLGQTPCAYSWLPMTLEFRGALGTLSDRPDLSAAGMIFEIWLIARDRGISSVLDFQSALVGDFSAGNDPRSSPIHEPNSRFLRRSSNRV